MAVFKLENLEIEINWKNSKQEIEWLEVLEGHLTKWRIFEKKTLESGNIHMREKTKRL